MDFNHENPFSEELNSEAIRKLFTTERDHMAAEGYSESSDNAALRSEAIITIRKYYQSDDLDRFIPYLAVTYFDRFISRRPLPTLKEGPQESLNLFAICCLTIAWKMRNGEFSMVDFLKEYPPIGKRMQIREMETLILSELQWRMRSLTPFCFLDFFLSSSPLSLSKRKELKQYTALKIYCMQHDIKYTEFRPSIIAASTLMIVSAKMCPSKWAQIEEEIVTCEYIDHGKLFYCWKRVRESVGWSPKTVKTTIPPPSPSPQLPSSVDAQLQQVIMLQNQREQHHHNHQEAKEKKYMEKKLKTANRERR